VILNFFCLFCCSHTPLHRYSDTVYSVLFLLSPCSLLFTVPLTLFETGERNREIFRRAKSRNLMATECSSLLECNENPVLSGLLHATASRCTPSTLSTLFIPPRGVILWFTCPLTCCSPELYVEGPVLLVLSVIEVSRVEGPVL
jgi:hypothetical protein